MENRPGIVEVGAFASVVIRITRSSPIANKKRTKTCCNIILNGKAKSR